MKLGDVNVNKRIIIGGLWIWMQRTTKDNLHFFKKGGGLQIALLDDFTMETSHCKLLQSIQRPSTSKSFLTQFRWIKENVPDWQETVVCSPDEGGTRRAGILAEKLHLPMALIHKESFNEDHIISGNVHDKKVRHLSYGVLN